MRCGRGLDAAGVCARSVAVAEQPLSVLDEGVVRLAVGLREVGCGLVARQQQPEQTLRRTRQRTVLVFLVRFRRRLRVRREVLGMRGRPLIGLTRGREVDGVEHVVRRRVAPGEGLESVQAAEGGNE